MGLNPSNILDKDLKGFPTLGDPPFPYECKESAIEELRIAGFPRGSETLTMREREVYKKGSEPDKLASMGIYMPGSPAFNDPANREWAELFTVKANLYGWEFDRAWYYWIAVADNEEFYIPKKTAIDFNKEFRLEVRVTGYAGGTDVKGPVGSYHIDTPRGLKAFVELLKGREEEIKAERQKLYEDVRKGVRI